MRKFCFVILALLAGRLPAETECTAKLVDSLNASTVYTWENTEIWQDGYVPASATDKVSLTYGDGTKRLILSFPKGNTTLDSIVDVGPNSYLKFVGVSAFPAGYRIGFRQLEGFNGYWPLIFQYGGNWTVMPNEIGFNLLGTAEEPTVVNSLFNGMLPALGVPSANGVGKLHRLYNGGGFRKDGAGELVMDGLTGVDTTAYVENGTLTLDYDAADIEPAVATNPVAWFDATNPNILFETVGDKQFVTNWPCSGGLSLYAKPSATTGWGPSPSGKTDPGRPWLSGKTANGKRLIDFGRYTYYNVDEPDSDDPAGQMDPSVNLKGLVEVFYAIELRPGISNTHAPVFGDGGTQYLNLASQTNQVVTQPGIPAVAYGELRINGRPWLSADQDNDPFRMRVVSQKLKSGETQSFNRLGGWANATSGGRGGIRLGEAIAYTRELTERERRATIAYLMKRWLGERYQVETKSWDIGNVVARGDGAKVSVPDGKTAHIRRFVQNGTNEVGLVKTGAGTLDVERLSPPSAPLTVEGGKLKLVDDLGGADATAALPADPAAHFDASDGNSFTYETENRIMVWHDVRPGFDLAATNLWDCRVTPAVPCDKPVRLADASPTGKAVVDFPTEGVGWSYTSAPRLAFTHEVEMREGFIVWKSDNPKVNAPGHFCYSQNSDFSSRTLNCLLHSTSTTSYFVPGAQWAVNGVPCDPHGTDFGRLGGESDWVVIRYSGPLTMVGTARKVAKVDAFATQGGKLNSCYGGGCRIGELIVYDHELTERERRDIEAYLMKRWLGKEHPDNAKWQGSLTFADGATAEIETEQDIEPTTLDSASSQFTKRGSGTMSVGRLATNVTSITVAEGGFGASLRSQTPLYQMCRNAWLHLDASNEETLELVTDANGAKLVSKWNDVRGNGRYAEANLVNCQTSPVYRTSGETGLAEGLPFVDFGPRCDGLSKSDYLATNRLTSCMALSEENSNVLEMHFVWADNATGVKGGFPLGNTSSSQVGFIRDDWKYLSKSYENLLVDMRVDGTVTDQDTVKPAGFEVVSMVVTGCNTPDKHTAGKVNQLAMDRRLKVGGVKLAEVVVFDKVLSAEDRAAIDAELMAKWRGIGTKTLAQAPAVSVAAGAAASFTNAANSVFGAVSGAGTFTVDVLNLAEGLDLTVCFDENGGCTQLKTSGELALPEFATLTLSFPDGFKPQTDHAYRIIDTAAIIGAENAANWSVVNPLGAKREARLSVDAANGDVLLQFSAPGMMLIVR